MTLSHHVKVLIVDDERLNILPLRLALMAERYEVDSALSGKEAITKIENSSPDIILLDAMMPVMNGFELARILKGDLRFKYIPILMIASAMADDAVKCRLAGADDVISKPVTSEKLLACIKTHLKKEPLGQM